MIASWILVEIDCQSACQPGAPTEVERHWEVRNDPGTLISNFGIIKKYLKKQQDTRLNYFPSRPPIGAPLEPRPPQNPTPFFQVTNKCRVSENLIRRAIVEMRSKGQRSVCVIALRADAHGVLVN
jgi:hypothetical protein